MVSLVRMQEVETVPRHIWRRCATALGHYNGGEDASYPGEVMARIAKYR
jgi:hypothetical protein